MKGYCILWKATAVELGEETFFFWLFMFYKAQVRVFEIKHIDLVGFCPKDKNTSEDYVSGKMVRN